jgi:hypothetical protein
MVFREPNDSNTAAHHTLPRPARRTRAIILCSIDDGIGWDGSFMFASSLTPPPPSKTVVGW